MTSFGFNEGLIYNSTTPSGGCVGPTKYIWANDDFGGFLFEIYVPKFTFSNVCIRINRGVC